MEAGSLEETLATLLVSPFLLGQLSFSVPGLRSGAEGVTHLLIQYIHSYQNSLIQ